jgi:hypothetical protein
LYRDISFALQQGEVLFVRGPSGVGKSLLLRSLAHLDPFDCGSIELDGKSAEEWTVPKWRSLVTYVHQQRISLRGNPSEFWWRVQQFRAQHGRPRGDLPALIHDLGLEQGVLNQPWTELSVSVRPASRQPSGCRARECGWRDTPGALRTHTEAAAALCRADRLSACSWRSLSHSGPRSCCWTSRPAP